MDPRTPVIVGVGQVTNRRERIVDPMTLMDEAVAIANADAGGNALARVGSVQVLSVVSRRYSASASELATRLKLGTVERISTTVGGSTPQWLVNLACDRIASGELDGVLITGAEALDSARRAAKEGIELEPPGEASGEDEVIGDDRPPVNNAEIRAGVVAPATIYPMFEQALAAEAGRTPDEQRAWLGELMSRFTDVAATHRDLAWFPKVRDASFLSDVSPDNRMVAEPYPKNLNSILQVDMSAALILLSAEAAEAAGVPREKWIFPWAGAKCDDVYLVVERPELARARGIEAAARAMFDASGMGVDDVTFFDFYSCFPSAVQMGAAALGVSLDDARGLTVTGGLPSFGGPGNNYMTHSIATMATKLREHPGATGVTTGVSWYMSKHSIGLYGTEPPLNGWRLADTKKEQAKIDATALKTASDASGEAVVDAFTVEHDREHGPVRAPIYATLTDGRRVVATPADPSIPAALSGRSIIGETVRVSTGEGGTTYELCG
jgi:acetyl-CoA C-acetyltransferase